MKIAIKPKRTTVVELILSLLISLFASVIKLLKISGVNRFESESVKDSELKNG